MHLITVFGFALTRDHLIALGQLVVHLTAFILYNRKAINQESKPSKATWALWSVLAAINAVSYGLTTGDWFKTALSIFDAVACTVTLIIVLRYRGTTELAKNEIRALVIGLSAAFIGALLRSGFVANAMLQLAMIVSFYPALVSTWEHPRHEPRVPWALWTGVYISNLVLVCLRWRGSWQDLVHPIVYIILHGAIWVLTMRSESRPEVVTSVVPTVAPVEDKSSSGRPTISQMVAVGPYRDAIITLAGRAASERHPIWSAIATGCFLTAGLLIGLYVAVKMSILIHAFSD